MRQIQNPRNKEIIVLKLNRYSKGILGKVRQFCRRTARMSVAKDALALSGIRFCASFSAACRLRSE